MYAASPHNAGPVPLNTYLHVSKCRGGVGRMKFSDQLRAAVEGCGITRFQLARETGVPESSLSRFVASGTGLSLRSLDKLADFLRLSVEIKGLRVADRKRLGVG